MKKNLYRSICLLISCLLTGYLFIHISYMYRGYTRLMGFYALEKDSIDVVFLGTSITFSSFMPMEAWKQYGYTTYNYCTNLQFEGSMVYSLREICKTQSPQLIVIDVAPFINQHWVTSEDWPDQKRDTYIKYNLDSMRYSAERTALAIRINNAIGGGVRTLFHYLFDIEHYHDRTPVPEQWNNAVNDIGRGYEHISGNVIDEAALVADDGSEMPLGEPHEGYFQELMAEADTLNAQIIYYCAPVNFNNIESVARKNYIKRIVQETGHTFWDLSGESAAIGLDLQQDFYDVNHFDALGAEKVTNFLAPQLDEVYDLPDHRDDPAYESWHHDYEVWVERKENFLAQDRPDVYN